MGILPVRKHKSTDNPVNPKQAYDVFGTFDDSARELVK